jgi:hypothetical protein
MSINMYVINAILVLMISRQVREHPLGLRSLAAPVLAVGAAAVLFLRPVPIDGGIMLEAACVAVAAAIARARHHIHDGPEKSIRLVD